MEDRRLGRGPGPAWKRDPNRHHNRSIQKPMVITWSSFRVNCFLHKLIANNAMGKCERERYGLDVPVYLYHGRVSSCQIRLSVGTTKNQPKSSRLDPR